MLVLSILNSEPTMSIGLNSFLAGSGQQLVPEKATYSDSWTFAPDVFAIGVRERERQTERERERKRESDYMYETRADARGSVRTGPLIHTCLRVAI
jgi:hypothetical protein